MEGSEYNIEKMLNEFTKKTNVQPGGKKFEAFENCLNESKLYNHVIYYTNYVINLVLNYIKLYKNL